MKALDDPLQEEAFNEFKMESVTEARSNTGGKDTWRKSRDIL